MLLLASVAMAGSWLEPALVGGVWSYDDWDDARLIAELADAQVVALGDGAAVVSTRAGDWLVTAEKGVERLLPHPRDWRWVGVGAGGVPYALSGGRLLRDGVATGIAADRADVVPGMIAVGLGSRVTIYSEPGLEVLGRTESNGPVFATTEGMAAVARSSTLVVFSGRWWGEIPRPAGTVTRVGAQIQVAGAEERVALDSDGTGWNFAGEGGDLEWWTRQLGVSRRPEAKTGGTGASVRYPQPPPPKPPPPPPGSVKQKSVLLQMIGTAGSTDGRTAVEDILRDGGEYWLEAAPPVAPGSTDVLFLSDGRRDDGGWTRPPHALVVDRKAGSVTLATVPPDCAPDSAQAHRGLVLLWCAREADQEVFAWTGSGWASEGVLAEGRGASRLSGAEDGTLLYDVGSAVYVRSPVAPGAGEWWRISGGAGARALNGGAVVLRSPERGRVVLEFFRDGATTQLFAGAGPPGWYNFKVTGEDLEIWGTGWNGYDGLLPTRVTLP